MIDRTQSFLTSRFNRCRKFKMKNLKDMMCLLVPYYELSAHRGTPSWSQSRFSYQFPFDTSNRKFQISLNAVLEYCFRDPLVTMEIGLKSQAIFEIPQVLMGRSLGSRWTIFASMQILSYSWLQIAWDSVPLHHILLCLVIKIARIQLRTQNKARLPAVLCRSLFGQVCTRGRGGGTQQMFIRGDSAPRSNPLPFYRPFFTRKVPFHIPCLELSIPFNCCKYTVFSKYE